jgi:class 3 adenylate cyclase
LRNQFERCRARTRHNDGELDKGIRTLLFADIVESTALTQRPGDDGAMEVLGTDDKIVRASLALRTQLLFFRRRGPTDRE